MLRFKHSRDAIKVTLSTKVYYSCSLIGSKSEILGHFSLMLLFYPGKI